MSDKKSKYSKSSASGERRLVSGISNQYKIIGELTLKNLRKLKGIKLVDDDAGQLDDFQICMGNKIDSYQIKWSKIPGPISFSNITKEIENRSLIKDVATSWKNIREKYTSKKVIAHILTNDYASLGDKVIKDKELAKNQKKPKRNNFASFIEECWKHFKKSGEIKKEWEIGWNNLQNASGLNENEFKDFVFNCELDLMYKQFESDNSIKKNKKEENINHISEKLRECVAKSFETVKLDKDTLLELLNWSKFNEYKNKHEFPVDELYQPIQSNVNQLKNCLDNVSNGYIYVFGTPGSGKSSFLSDFLKGIDERVIYYYNYIPHETTSFLKRGEAENFFHDIINAIRDEGFDNSEILDDNVNQLGKQFLDHINLLYKDWEENNNRTIFLIDGIDHIEREQNPISSLLDYLPPSSDIPEGIIFIFGSQTEKALPPKIRSSYNKINMDPLNKDELFKVIEKKKSLNLSKRQKNRIFYL